MGRDEPLWRKTIVDRLIDRNKRTTASFTEIITQSKFSNLKFVQFIVP